MSTPLIIGIIGAGRMNQRAHIPNLLAEGCTVAAITDTRPRTADLVARHFHIPRVCQSTEELLSMDELDAVCISIPDEYHAGAAIAALGAGKHVFMEKPLSTNSVDGKVMIDAAAKSGKKFHVGFQRRHDPGAEILKNLVDEWVTSGEMGTMKWMMFVGAGGDWNCTPDPLISTDEPIPPQPDGTPLPEWLPDHHRRWFGAINNGRSHGLDLLRYLFGPPESVVAAHPDRNESIHFMWNGASVFFVEGTYEGGRWNEFLEIHYENGWVRFRTPPALHENTPGIVEVYRGGPDGRGHYEEHQAPYEWAFRREIQHFIRSVNENIPESPTPEDAYWTLKLVEDVFKTALTMPEPVPVSERTMSE